MSDFLPVDSLGTPRFCGSPTFMRLRQTTELDGVDAAVVGIPSDSGGPYRTGARFGPNAIRAMSVMLRPISPYHGGINVFEACRTIDFGDVNVVPGYLMETFERIEAYVDALVQRNVFPIGLGGDHSVTLPELRAVAKKHGPIALLQFDSHVDTWDNYFAEKKYSAGTPFRRAVEEGIIVPERSLQVGMRGSLFTENDIKDSRELGFTVVTTDEMYEMGIPALAEFIKSTMAEHKVFITFDMDFIDPAYAPGVQTPEAGGPSSRETLQLIRLLAGLDIVGCDVVETNPLFDSPAQITALLAATVASEFLALYACKREGVGNAGRPDLEGG